MVMFIVKTAVVILSAVLAAINFFNAKDRWNPFLSFYESGKADLCLGLFYALAAMFYLYLIAIGA